MNDCDSNSATFYDSVTPSDRYKKFRSFWVQLATAFKDTDYIAGYGILAEPSASRTAISSPDDPVPQPVTMLTTFQSALMNKINAAGSVGDTWTPFWVGTDFNYDTLQFRYEDYDYLANLYPNRVVYVVNCLMPKPWIQDGKTPASGGIPNDWPYPWDECYGPSVGSHGGTPGSPISYPQTPPPNNDFSFLLVRSQEDIDNGIQAWQYETIFNKRRAEVENGNYASLLNPEFLSWYLNTYALGFAAAKNVPLVLDQFGASTDATGYLTYEHDLLSLVETSRMHWTRWGYNAGSDTRRLLGNTTAYNYYHDIGTRTAAGQVLNHATAESGGSSTVRIRAEDYSRQAPASPDNYRWQYEADTGALDGFALRANAVPPTGNGAVAASLAPHMDFRVNFPATISYPATYNVWIRMRDGSTTNGVWVGIDGAAGTGQHASNSPSAWSWVKRLSNSSSRSKVTVPSSGFHVFNVWMNKPTTFVDEIILTTDAAFDPNVSALPSYSARVIDLPTP